MATEQGEPDDLGQVPSISTKTREMSKLQDMYRQTLAASWAAQTGEMPADKVIEDIFAGGDGWGGNRTSGVLPATKRASNGTEGYESDGDSRTLRENGRKSPRYEPRRQKSASHSRVGSRGTTHSATQSIVCILPS